VFGVSPNRGFLAGEPEIARGDSPGRMRSSSPHLGHFGSGIQL
jgi:hypothetical protein